MEPTIIDKAGLPLSVGDKVAYATTVVNSGAHRTGHIIATDNNKIRIQPEDHHEGAKRVWRKASSVTRISGGDTITIPRRQYDRLIDAQDKLDCLEAAGVDNWDGYGEAMELYEEVHG